MGARSFGAQGCSSEQAQVREPRQAEGHGQRQAHMRGLGRAQGCDLGEGAMRALGVRGGAAPGRARAAVGQGGQEGVTSSAWGGGWRERGAWCGCRARKGATAGARKGGCGGARGGAWGVEGGGREKRGHGVCGLLHVGGGVQGEAACGAGTERRQRRRRQRGRLGSVRRQLRL